MAQHIILLHRAIDADFGFLKQLVTDPTTAEYGGFNTTVSREQGHTLRQAAKVTYAPLICLYGAT